MDKIAAVHKEIVVEATAAHAFDVFTRGIDRWWPRQHHIGKSPLKTALLDDGVGGRWYSICEDGTQVDIGKVLAWDPPRRLLLAWQITADWQFDANLVTEVEVTFTVEGPRRTRVVLEHRDLERFGDKAVELRKSIDSEGGWGLILAEFGRVTAESSAA